MLGTNMGLIWLLRGRPVIVLTSTEATLRCLSGAHLTYRRQNSPAPEIVTSADDGADAMSGRSRRKAARVELAIAKCIGAKKVSRAYQAGHDLELLLGDDLLRIECKARADGFRELYRWLDGRDILVVKADRQEPLVVLRMSAAGSRRPAMSQMRT
jgi:hypothetical protein